jgi:hypothetical protein
MKVKSKGNKPVAKKASMKKKSGSSFAYTATSADALKRRSEQSGGRFDSPYKQNVDLWRPKAGDNTVRILPPTWDDHEHYGLDVFLHRYIGSDNSSYVCLQKMKGKFCPVCVAAKAAKDAGEADEAKSLQAAHVILVWILDRSSDSTQPVLWPMSWTIDRDIATLCHNKRSGKVLLIDHPEEGYDVSFRRSGEGIMTRYSAFQIDRDPSPISDDGDVMEKVLDFISENPLPTVLNFHDAKHLEGVLAGTTEAKDTLEDDEDEDEDDDEEEAPKKKTASKSKPKPVVEDDDEEEEEEDEDEEEADDEEEDDDEDDDAADTDDDEEEEEEAGDEEDDEDDEDERPAASARKRLKPAAKKIATKKRR